MSRDAAFPEDGLDAWRPQSLRPPVPAWPGPRLRMGVLLAVLAAHLLVALALPWLEVEPESRDEAVLVTFVERLPEPPPAPVPDAVPAPAEPRIEPRAPDRPSPKPRRKPRISVPLQAQPSLPPPPSSADIYGPDGRLVLPPDLLDQIDRRMGDTRTFDYQVPGMERAGKLLNRPPPIAFERTRFDEYWKPDQDLLTALLTQMVEKTTKEIRIPVPGRSNSTMVCHVSLLALGGSCGVLTPGSDYVGPVDDPDTLSAEEDRQCQAWWEQIVGAKSQDAWRRTRKLYEEQCRKPRERLPAG
jgi:hypothetical protein